MHSLILLSNPDSSQTLDSISTLAASHLRASGHKVEVITLHDKKIGNCVGCFGCWLKTPGECTIDDHGREVARAFISADLAVIITPISFGGYSSHFKKFMDRFIPNIQPFFKAINGEYHHPPRYKKRPNMLFIGVETDADTERERIFKSLVVRNAKNIMGKRNGSKIFLEGAPKRELDPGVKEALKGVGLKGMGAGK